MCKINNNKNKTGFYVRARGTAARVVKIDGSTGNRNRRSEENRATRATVRGTGVVIICLHVRMSLCIKIIYIYRRSLNQLCSFESSIIILL